MRQLYVRWREKRELSRIMLSLKSPAKYLPSFRYFPSENFVTNISILTPQKLNPVVFGRSGDG